MQACRNIFNHGSFPQLPLPIDGHLHKINEKLHVQNRTEAINKGIWKVLTLTGNAMRKIHSLRKNLAENMGIINYLGNVLVPLYGIRTNSFFTTQVIYRSSFYTCSFNAVWL